VGDFSGLIVVLRFLVVFIFSVVCFLGPLPYPSCPPNGSDGQNCCTRYDV